MENEGRRFRGGLWKGCSEAFAGQASVSGKAQGQNHFLHPFPSPAHCHLPPWCPELGRMGPRTVSLTTGSTGSLKPCPLNQCCLCLACRVFCSHWGDESPGLRSGAPPAFPACCLESGHPLSSMGRYQGAVLICPRLGFPLWGDGVCGCRYVPMGRELCACPVSAATPVLSLCWDYLWFPFPLVLTYLHPALFACMAQWLLPGTPCLAQFQW